MVMVNGRLYDAATLNEVASGTRQRGRLYWRLAAPGLPRDRLGADPRRLALGGC
jgi:hypothetical protein